MGNSGQIDPHAVVTHRLITGDLVRQRCSDPIITHIAVSGRSVQAIGTSHSFFRNQVGLNRFAPVPGGPVVTGIFIRANVTRRLNDKLQGLVETSQRCARQRPRFHSNSVFRTAVPVIPTLGAISNSNFTDIESMIRGSTRRNTELVNKRHISNGGTSTATSNRVSSQTTVLSTVGQHLARISCIAMPRLTGVARLSGEAIHGFLGNLITRKGLVTRNGAHNQHCQGK